MVSNMPQRQRVLIIGSSSSTGTELLHALSNEKASRRPVIFAFCKQTAKLDQATKERCNRVLHGDYKQEADIVRAMKKSKADTVIFAPKEKSSCVSFSNSTQTALEAVLDRPEYSHVRLFSLNKEGVSAATCIESKKQTQQPQQQEQEQQHQLATTSPKGHKRKSTPPVLKDALEGLSEFLQYVTCSNISRSRLSESEKSTKSTFGKPWKKQRSNLSPLFTKSLMDMVDVEERDAPPTARTFDSEMSSPPPSPVHLTVSKKNFVEFVVGAILEGGSSSSISSHGVARGILITAE